MKLGIYFQSHVIKWWLRSDKARGCPWLEVALVVATILSLREMRWLPEDRVY
jgi:hypothetical protein